MGARNVLGTRRTGCLLVTLACDHGAWKESLKQNSLSPASDDRDLDAPKFGHLAEKLN